MSENAKANVAAPKKGRKRRLNVIYFVDSARTRSFSVPIGRLNVLLFGFLALLTWSVASVALLVWLGQDRREVSERLHTALATIFEYEQRNDQVYEMAYPNGTRVLDSVAAEDESDAADEPSDPATPAEA
jgi:hypothetical protein